MKPRKPVKTIEYGPKAEKSHDYSHVRWVENVSGGLRLVGFADEIARKAGNGRWVTHKGWFTSEDENEVYRGIVYRLPARNGVEQYVYGYDDPNNDDCALLCFNVETDEKDAVRAADRFAEIHAEHERDYQRAWRAGRDFEELAEEIKTARKEALAIGAEMRAAKRANLEAGRWLNAPTICATLRKQIVSLYRSIQRAREKRAELKNNFGRCEGFTE